MTTIASSSAPAASVHNKMHLMDKTASSNTSFDNLFSDALAKSQSQIEIAQSIGLSNDSALSMHAANHSNKAGSSSTNLQDGSLNPVNAPTVNKAQQAHQPHDSKKTRDKTHSPVKNDSSSSDSSSANNAQSNTAASSANTDSNAGVGNTQTLQANATKTDSTPNPTPTMDNVTSAAQPNVHGLTGSQQAFFSGLPEEGGINSPNNDLTEGQSGAMNANNFAQAMVEGIQNTSLNGSSSFMVAGGALNSIAGSSALSGANGLKNLSAQNLTEDLIYAEGVQDNSAASVIDNNPSLNGPTSSATLSIAPPLGEGPWAAALGQQALFIAKNQMGSAQLTLNPEHLGPIQVTLDLKHDQATAVFVSPHEAVRQAIEASLPHLRDMFTQAGLQLGHTQVQPDLSGQFAQFSQQNQDQRTSGGGSSASSLNTMSEDATVTPSLIASAGARVSHGLLDTFA